MTCKPIFIACLVVLTSCVRAEPAAAPQADGSKAVQFPGVEVDRLAKQVRVACETLAVEGPLEFFCVTNGGPEHEAVVRTAAKPSHIHAGLLLLGLEPGSPMTYSPARNAWTPPFGPPVRITMEWKNAAGEVVRASPEKLMRSMKTNEPAPTQGFIFAGSHQREDGAYLADLTGYVVSICNFEHTLIDVPRLVSNDNATLEWEYNVEFGPTRGTPMTMILEPVAGQTRPPATTQPTHSDDGLTDEQRAESAQIAALRDKWRAAVKPHTQAMQDAAKAHYEVIADLKKRQQKLIDEADRLQALIDELERTYQDMTAPQP